MPGYVSPRPRSPPCPCRHPPAAPASPSGSPSPTLPGALPQHPPPPPLPGPRDCKELLTRGHFLSGWHTVYLPDCRPLVVLCDMHTDGGGWTVSVPDRGGCAGGSGGRCVRGDSLSLAFVPLSGSQLSLLLPPIHRGQGEPDSCAALGVSPTLSEPPLPPESPVGTV